MPRKANAPRTRHDVSAFLDSFPNPAKQVDGRTLLALMQEVTGESGELVDESVVAFGRCRLPDEGDGEEEGVLVAFAPRLREFVVYIMPGLDDYGGLLERLGKHKHREGRLYIKRLSDVDLAVLRDLVSRSVADMRRMYPD